MKKYSKFLVAIITFAATLLPFIDKVNACSYMAGERTRPNKFR